MFTSALIPDASLRHAESVVPVFSGRTERFVLRALRLLQRSLAGVSGDAGMVLGKHLRTRVPADAVDGLLGDFMSLLTEIRFLEDQVHRCEKVPAKWSSKHEFFLLAMLEAGQRGDAARATEAAIALLDTFQVRSVLTASAALATCLETHGLRLMPIGDAAFNYFADYRPVNQPAPQVNIPTSTLRLVG